MLEVLARRYYGNKDLTDLQARAAAGRTYVTAQRRGTTLVSAATSFAGLDQAICGLVELIDVTSSVDADIYVSWEDQPDDFDEMAAALQNIVSARMPPPPGAPSDDHRRRHRCGDEPPLHVPTFRRRRA